MLIFPAIDLVQGKAVRLFKGDYAQMTVYNENPLEVAKDFEAQGASWIHMVDLEAAKSGEITNIATVASVAKNTSLKVEIGGGIRNMDTIARYLDAGVSRVIIGSAAVTDPAFAEKAAALYGGKIAAGVDIKDGKVAIHGWTEKSELEAFDFCKRMENIGIGTIISTDISKDGAMQGTNHALYKELSQRLSIDIIASGGVSSIEDVKKLRALDIYGAIIGKAYYTGAVSLREAIGVAK